MVYSPLPTTEQRVEHSATHKKNSAAYAWEKTTTTDGGKKWSRKMFFTLFQKRSDGVEKLSFQVKFWKMWSCVHIQFAVVEISSKICQSPVNGVDDFHAFHLPLWCHCRWDGSSYIITYFLNKSHVFLGGRQRRLMMFWCERSRCFLRWKMSELFTFWRGRRLHWTICLRNLNLISFSFLFLISLFTIIDWQNTVKFALQKKPL